MLIVSYCAAVYIVLRTAKSSINFNYQSIHLLFQYMALNHLKWRENTRNNLLSQIDTIPVDLTHVDPSESGFFSVGVLDRGRMRERGEPDPWPSSQAIWQEWLIEAIGRIKNQKQRPSAERICHAVRQTHTKSSGPILRDETILTRLNHAVADGKILKVCNKGQTSYKEPSHHTRQLALNRGADLTKVSHRFIHYRRISSRYWRAGKNFQLVFFMEHGFLRRFSLKAYENWLNLAAPACPPSRSTCASHLPVLPKWTCRNCCVWPLKKLSTR